MKIKSGVIEAEAELRHTETAKKIYEALPLTGMVNRWGKEIYFSIPVYIGEEKGAKEVVEIGDIAYWPTGNCFCIFFGKTPASKGNNPVAASKVNVFGKILGDAKAFEKARDGDEISVSKK
ncbi:hypothetical protein J4458_07220 [Candidatus Woesearchaeota archaeon]|nr:hypothetical protein [Candidatus Woesearchaeota archaeon]